MVFPSRLIPWYEPCGMSLEGKTMSSIPGWVIFFFEYGKEELSNTDRLVIQSLIKKIETLNNKFHHTAPLHHRGITRWGGHRRRTSGPGQSQWKGLDLIKRLQQLVLEPEEAASGSLSASADGSMPLQRQLERITKRIHIIDKTTRSLCPGPAVDQCLLRQLEEEAVILKAVLADTGRAITMLETGEEGVIAWTWSNSKSLFVWFKVANQEPNCWT